MKTLDSNGWLSNGWLKLKIHTVTASGDSFYASHVKL